MHAVTYVYFALANTICLYVHEGSSIVSICILLACQFFIATNLIYRNELTFSEALFKVIILFLFFVSVSLILMVVNYMKKLQAALRVQNEADKMLLDNMHEGVMILGQIDVSKQDVIDEESQNHGAKSLSLEYCN